jgi:hypothetical protein
MHSVLRKMLVFLKTVYLLGEFLHYDRVQWCCVRRTKDTGHHKNCVKSNEAEWPVEFIGPSKS